MSDQIQVSLADIQAAQKFLRKYLPPTPLLRNAWLSDKLECDLYLKLENMQPIGSFKIRGATYKISRLTAEEKARGVIAASAGNHAQGVAWGAKQLGVSAVIVMPKAATLMKIQNTIALGAEVQLDGETYDDAYAMAREVMAKTGRVYVHAYEDADVIAGQGTVGLEIAEQLPDVDYVIGSLGGGGMMAGVAIALKELMPKAKLVGCQASGAPSLVRSIREGKAVKLDSVQTFTDGISVKNASEAMRQLLAPRLDELCELDDEEIAAGVLTLMEKAKVVVEGSGAITMAAASKMKDKLKGKKVVLILSGGNIDVNLISRIIDRGLIEAGRRVRLNVVISDRTGSLAKLTQILAREGANVIQAIHDRNEPFTRIDQTEVALTLETRGPDHSKQVIEALRGNVLRLEEVH